MDKKKILGRAMHEKTYNELILAMQDKVLFEVVEDPIAEKLPNEDAQFV